MYKKEVAIVSNHFMRDSFDLMTMILTIEEQKYNPLPLPLTINTHLITKVAQYNQSTT